MNLVDYHVSIPVIMSDLGVPKSSNNNYIGKYEYSIVKSNSKLVLRLFDAKVGSWISDTDITNMTTKQVRNKLSELESE